MSLMTLLLAFAPSAIAARRRDDEVETLHKENRRLQAERDAVHAELDRVRQFRTLDALYRLNHEQAAMAQAAIQQQQMRALHQQMLAQQAQPNPLGQHNLLQYNQQQNQAQGQPLLGLQAQNWQGEDYCNCVPDRAELFSRLERVTGG